MRVFNFYIFSQLVWVFLISATVCGFDSTQSKEVNLEKASATKSEASKVDSSAEKVNTATQSAVASPMDPAARQQAVDAQEKAYKQYQKTMETAKKENVKKQDVEALTKTLSNLIAVPKDLDPNLSIKNNPRKAGGGQAAAAQNVPTVEIPTAEELTAPTTEVIPPKIFIVLKSGKEINPEKLSYSDVEKLRASGELSKEQYHEVVRKMINVAPSASDVAQKETKTTEQATLTFDENLKKEEEKKNTAKENVNVETVGEISPAWVEFLGQFQLNPDAKPTEDNNSKESSVLYGSANGSDLDSNTIPVQFGVPEDQNFSAKKSDKFIQGQEHQGRGIASLDSVNSVGNGASIIEKENGFFGWVAKTRKQSALLLFFVMGALGLVVWVGIQRRRGNNLKATKETIASMAASADLVETAGELEVYLAPKLLQKGRADLNEKTLTATQNPFTQAEHSIWAEISISLSAVNVQPKHKTKGEMFSAHVLYAHFQEGQAASKIQSQEPILLNIRPRVDLDHGIKGYYLIRDEKSSLIYLVWAEGKERKVTGRVKSGSILPLYLIDANALPTSNTLIKVSAVPGDSTYEIVDPLEKKRLRLQYDSDMWKNNSSRKPKSA